MSHPLRTYIHESQFLHSVSLRSSRDDHQLAALRGRDLLDKDEQRLEHHIAEARPEAHVFDEALEVIEDDHGERRLVGVLEDGGDLARLAAVREAEQHVGGDELDEGELGLDGEVRGERRLAAAYASGGARSRTLDALEADGEERRVVGGAHLLGHREQLGEQLAEVCGVVEDAVAEADGELVLLEPEGGLHLLQRALEVLPGDAHLRGVDVHLAEVVDVDLALQREGRRALHQPLQLGAREVLRALRQLREVDVVRQVAVGAHGAGVDGEDLHAALVRRQPDLHVHLEAARAQQRGVDEVLAVRHADDQHVVQRLHAVDLREQLVHDAVVHAGACFAARRQPHHRPSRRAPCRSRRSRRR